MAPGGPGLQNPAPNAPNGATATHLVTFLIFGVFSVQKHGVSVLNRHKSVLVWQPHSVLVWQPHSFLVCQPHRAVRAGGGRAVAPTLTPLVSTHTPKIAIPMLGG